MTFSRGRLARLKASAAVTAALFGGATVAHAHTDSVGFKINQSSATTCAAGTGTTCFDVEVFYGSWHSGGIAAEGDLAIFLQNDDGTETQVIGQSAAGGSQVPFSTNHSLVGTIPNNANPHYADTNGQAYADLQTVFDLGSNYFYHDDQGPGLVGTPPPGDPDPIYSHQSAVAKGLGAGTYRIAYDAATAGGLSATWSPQPAIQSLTFTIGDDGSLIVEDNLGDSEPPVIAGPGTAPGADTSHISVNENQTDVTTFTADENATWAITGGADASHFSLDASTGVITFVTAPDHDAPIDADGNNTYVVEVSATDNSDNTSVQTLTVTVLGIDDPVISEAVSLVEVWENQTAVTTMGSNEPVSWSLSGGADQAAFTIDPATGALSFIEPPNFDQPTDTDGDNDYLVAVQATDAAGNASDQMMTVRVLNTTDTPVELFSEEEEKIQEIVRNSERNKLRASVAVNRRMTSDARDRFISSQARDGNCDADVERTTVEGPDQRLDVDCSILVTRNNVSLDIDGTAVATSDGLTVAGTWFQQIGNFEGTERRLFFGDFNVVHDSDGVETVQVAGRLAYERMLSDNLMGGVFLGSSLGRSDISGDYVGAVDSSSLALGTYVVAEIAEDVYFDGYVSGEAGWNEMEIASSQLVLDGDYFTKSFLVGGAVSGDLAFEKFDLRPAFTVDYGNTDIHDADFDATAFSMTQAVSTSFENVEYLSMSLVPEFRFPILPETVISVAPNATCEFTGDEQDCGGGLELGIRGSSPDGNQVIEARFDYDKVGDVETKGASLNLEYRF